MSKFVPYVWIIEGTSPDHTEREILQCCGMYRSEERAKRQAKKQTDFRARKECLVRPNWEFKAVRYMRQGM